MSIFRMAERLSGRWPDSQGFCGVRDFDEPQPAKTFPVPADDCLRLHDDEGVQATGPQTIEPDPECPVERRARGARLSPSPRDPPDGEGPES